MGDDKNEKAEPLVLSDGREISIDLGPLQLEQWRALFKPGLEPDKEDQIILQCVQGLGEKGLEGIAFLDWRKVIRAFYKAASQPLADPN